MHKLLCLDKVSEQPYNGLGPESRSTRVSLDRTYRRTPQNMLDHLLGVQQQKIDAILDRLTPSVHDVLDYGIKPFGRYLRGIRLAVRELVEPGGDGLSSPFSIHRRFDLESSRDSIETKRLHIAQGISDITLRQIDSDLTERSELAPVVQLRNPAESYRPDSAA